MLDTYNILPLGYLRSWTRQAKSRNICPRQSTKSHSVKLTQRGLSAYFLKT